MAWHGDPEGHSRAGKARRTVYSKEYMAGLGRKGGATNSRERMREIAALPRRKRAIDKIMEAVEAADEVAKPS